MASHLTIIAAAVGLSSLAVLAASTASIAYSLSRRDAARPSQALLRERLRVYHDLVANVIALNRTAVELDEEGLLYDDHDRLVLNQESELDAHLQDVTETFHRSYYLLELPVRDAISEYVDYVSSYHEAGIELGRILGLSGDVIQAIRDDIGLDDIFADAADLDDPDVADSDDLDSAADAPGTRDASSGRNGG